MVSVKISPEFKSQAYKAIFAVVLFILVYLMLFALAIGLLAACLFGAVKVIALKFSGITLGLAIGLAAVGFFAIFFMIKFVFSKNSADYSHLTEIDIETEPELHAMIRELVDETGTKFPKRIYVSPEVNASVFYDSGFWSMFLPVKKNLHIGLGLVNTTTVSELKGILAHEFGHFSQRSMKVGSYVYNVNKVIHNILYDNDDYEENVRRWSSRSGYFVLLIGIAIAFNKMVQIILRLMYKVVNVSYLGLSRQMEFHADAIAANIVGSRPMVSSLLRMNLASESYNNVIEYYNARFDDALVAENIFPQHIYALQFIARNNQIEFVNDFPEVKPEFFGRFNKSKLVINNQWDSHPSEEERIAAYEKYNIVDRNPDYRPANMLFKNLEELQRRVTVKIFFGVNYAKPTSLASVQSFADYMQANYEANCLPKIFNSYYDRHNVTAFDLEKAAADAQTKPLFENLFDNAKTELVYQALAQANDAATLISIAQNPLDLKTFDYDGQKYKLREAIALSESINKQAEANSREIVANDLDIFRFFYLQAKPSLQHHRLLELYQEYFKADSEYDKNIAIYGEMNDTFAFVYETTEFQIIPVELDKFKAIEIRFKQLLQELMLDPFYTDAVNDSAERRAKFEKYLADKHAYFSNQQYIQHEIDFKNEVVGLYAQLLGNVYFLKKKKLLDFQATLV
jgi:Zn-dependent protease with chaperone function